MEESNDSDLANNVPRDSHYETTKTENQREKKK